MFTQRNFRISQFKGFFQICPNLGFPALQFVRNKLLNLFPDKTLPRIEKLTNERKHLIEDIKELNEQYKQTVSELKELEFARQSIEDYLNVSDKSHKNELE